MTQKAKLQWSLEGDINTSYFHRAIKKRAMLNKVLMIEDMNGVLCTKGSQIQEAFLSYYKDLLGTSHETTDVNVRLVQRGKCCTQEHCDILLRPVTDDEIRKCLFSIPKDKFLGPDGNQGAFIQGRSILENILICQDLVRLYNRSNVSPRCIFKLDLQKAYDSIEWKFMDQMLAALAFPIKFRKMLMLCVTTTTFSLSLNEANFGYFKGRRGLRHTTTNPSKY
ncbi:uncharacterized protein LOC141649720 [Silene latifolia]|uniref:uncharacterized protein LOC141649720 n=1 Tax=Silene latifolia TaxID=37657 RepID=UPI003D77E0AC